MEIFNFEEHLSKLMESFNTPAEIKWVDKNDGKLIGLFMINDKIYQIRCLDKGNKVWTYKFYIYDVENNEFSLKLTNFKLGSLSVISTIRVGMEYLIKSKSPNSIIFAASDKKEGRKKLYYSFSEEIKKIHKYEFISNRMEDKQVYILYKNIDRELLFDIVKKITEEEI